MNLFLISRVIIVNPFHLEFGERVQGVGDTSVQGLVTRWDNPSVRHTEDMLAELETYDHALGFSSGMAAIRTTIMSHVKAGDRIVSIRESYGRTIATYTVDFSF